MTTGQPLRLLREEKGSSTEQAPYLIYTADCSNPQEIDDGLFIEPVPDNSETYRVNVCVADASKLYRKPDIRSEAMGNVHANYFPLPNNERGYEPMFDPVPVKGAELSEGKLRSALIVSFMVGKKTLPSEVSIKFGKIETVENLSYRDFSHRTRHRKDFAPYARASEFIISSLNYNQGGDVKKQKAGAGPQQVKPRHYGLWRSGAMMVESYMVAANHLTGKLLRDLGRPAIYRTHNPFDDTYTEFVHDDVAMYSQAPGPHVGLGVNPYCRVTSPLRRLEDFVMSHHLRLMVEGKDPTTHDLDIMQKAVRNLNRRAIADAENEQIARWRMARQARAQVTTDKQGEAVG